MAFPCQEVVGKKKNPSDEFVEITAVFIVNDKIAEVTKYMSPANPGNFLVLS